MAKNVPRLAKRYVGDAMLVAKGELDCPVLVKLAAVEPEVFLQRLCNKLLLVERRLSFPRHCELGCGW